jgi:outer membrane protein TolC
LKNLWIIALFVFVSPVHAKGLTLVQAIDLAEKNATELQILKTEQALAQATHKRSAQAFLPKISTDATLLRADSTLINDIPVPSPSLPPRVTYRDVGPVEGSIIGIQMIQPVFNADALKAREQAQKGLQARQRAYRWGRQTIRLHVAMLYYAVDVRQADEHAARMALQAAQKARGMARAAYQEGLAAQLDVFRANAEVASASARIQTAKADVREARINFATTLDLPLQDPLILASTLPKSLPPPTEQIALKKRSDLLAREAQYEAAAAGLDKAKARWLPSINLLGRHQWIDGNEAFDLYEDGWIVALNLQWTLFDGFDRQGEIAESRARKNLARIELEQTRRTVEKEQRLAISKWRAAWSAWQASIEALEAAEHSMKLARRRYQEGVGNMTDLLAVQAGLFQRRLEHARYQYQSLIASMNCYLYHGMDPLTVLQGDIP